MTPRPTYEHASVVQNVQAAVSIADKALLALCPQRQFVLLPEQTIERPFGWVFFYVPKRVKESGNSGDLIPGNRPLVVYRANGGTEYLSSSVPPAKAISGLELRLASARR